MIRCAGLIRGFCFVFAGVWAVPIGVAQTNKGASNAATERRQEQPPPKRPAPVASAPKTERSDTQKQQPAAAVQTPQTYMYTRPPTTGQPDGPQAKVPSQTPVQAKTAPQTPPAMTMPQAKATTQTAATEKKKSGLSPIVVTHKVPTKLPPGVGGGSGTKGPTQPAGSGCGQTTTPNVQIMAYRSAALTPPGCGQPAGPGPPQQPSGGGQQTGTNTTGTNTQPGTTQTGTKTQPGTTPTSSSPTPANSPPITRGQPPWTPPNGGWRGPLPAPWSPGTLGFGGTGGHRSPTGPPAVQPPPSTPPVAPTTQSNNNGQQPQQPTPNTQQPGSPTPNTSTPGAPTSSAQPLTGHGSNGPTPQPNVGGGGVVPPQIPQVVALTLTANPKLPEVGKDVVVVPELKPSRAGASYQLNWGDGSPVETVSDSGRHHYAKAKTYKVSATTVAGGSQLNHEMLLEVRPLVWPPVVTLIAVLGLACGAMHFIIKSLLSTSFRLGAPGVPVIRLLSHVPYASWSFEPGMRPPEGRITFLKERRKSGLEQE
jgi:hypothetical protein